MNTTFSVTLLSILSLIACQSFAADPPANSELAVEDSFDRAELGKAWSVNTGEWRIVDGILHAKELPADQHSAAARRVVETSNAVYQLKFRFVNQPKAFHFGFDPARGELKKKGHLFSVVITPTSWKVLKHVDKNRRKEDPNEILASQNTEFKTGEWYTLRVTTWQNYVTASIEGKEPLKCSHPTFGVKKPTLVFRCLGDGVQIDDLRVWKQRP